MAANEPRRATQPSGAGRCCSRGAATTAGRGVAPQIVSTPAAGAVTPPPGLASTAVAVGGGAGVRLRGPSPDVGTTWGPADDDPMATARPWPATGPARGSPSAAPGASCGGRPTGRAGARAPPPRWRRPTGWPPTGSAPGSPSASPGAGRGTRTTTATPGAPPPRPQRRPPRGGDRRGRHLGRRRQQRQPGVDVHRRWRHLDPRHDQPRPARSRRWRPTGWHLGRRRPRDDQAWTSGDDGATWTPATTAPTATPRVATNGYGTFVAVGSGSLAWTSNDNGMTWVPATSASDRSPAVATDGAAPGSPSASREPAWRSTDDGDTWSPPPSRPDGLGRGERAAATLTDRPSLLPPPQLGDRVGSARRAGDLRDEHHVERREQRGHTPSCPPDHRPAVDAAGRRRRHRRSMGRTPDRLHAGRPGRGHVTTRPRTPRPWPSAAGPRGSGTPSRRPTSARRGSRPKRLPPTATARPWRPTGAGAWVAVGSTGSLAWRSTDATSWGPCTTAPERRGLRGGHRRGGHLGHGRPDREPGVDIPPTTAPPGAPPRPAPTVPPWPWPPTGPAPGSPSATRGSRAWTSTDDGTTWSPATSSPTAAVASVATDGLGIWVTTGPGISAWTSSDDSTTSRRPPPPPPDGDTLGVATNGFGIFVAVGGGSRAWTSNDNGMTWVPATTPPDEIPSRWPPTVPARGSPSAGSGPAPGAAR